MRGATDAVAVARDVASSSPSKPASALDVMRYPRPSSDGLPLPNGIGSGGVSKKPAAPSPAPPTPAPRSSKDDVAPPAVATDSSRLAAFLASTSLEPKPRARPPQAQPPPQTVPTTAPTAVAAAVAAVSKSPARDHGHSHGSSGQHTSSDHSDPASPSSTGAGELLLQWGQNKRMRCRRDSASTSASPQRGRQAGGGGNKIQRRSPSPAADKLMPPPSTTAPYTRASCSLRPASPLPPRSGSSAGASDAHHARRPHPLRSAEDRAGAAGKFSAAAVARAEKQRAMSPHTKVGPGSVMGLGIPDPMPHPQQYNQGGSGSGSGQQLQAGAAAAGAGPSTKPALKLEVPRIYTTLSRKEKEEDFMAFKGTKLPQRPKRRPKNVEKTINSICPGMWLTDVTRSRYEVREKKCPKKQQKYRGLKGMESMDSDSD